jgi:hypothetical protein
LNRPNGLFERGSMTLVFCDLFKVADGLSCACWKEVQWDHSKWPNGLFECSPMSMYCIQMSQGKILRIDPIRVLKGD